MSKKSLSLILKHGEKIVIRKVPKEELDRTILRVQKEQREILSRKYVDPKKLRDSYVFINPYKLVKL